MLCWFNFVIYGWFQDVSDGSYQAIIDYELTYDIRKPSQFILSESFMTTSCRMGWRRVL